MTDYGPSDEDVEEWAVREHKRRQAWAAGPTAEEKERFADRAGYGTRPWSSFDDETNPGPADWRRRQSVQAVQWLWWWLTEAPYKMWSDLIDTDDRWESSFGRPPRRRRSPYDS
jgi:hypothetical protein